MKIYKTLAIVLMASAMFFGNSCKKEAVHEEFENNNVTSRAHQFKTGYFLIDIPATGYEEYFTASPNGELSEYFLEVGSTNDSLPLVGTLYFEVDEDYKITKLGCTENIAQYLSLETGLLNNHELTNDLLELLEQTIGNVDPQDRPSGLWAWIKKIFWGERKYGPCNEALGYMHTWVQHWNGDHGFNTIPCP
jgi:hypothetical protein